MAPPMAATPFPPTPAHAAHRSAVIETGAQALSKAMVSTPVGTLNINLTQSPSLPVPFLHNPANALPVVAFIGVILTVWFGWRKMKIELAAAADQARQEREHARDEARQDRTHDAKEAHLERLTKARREVYLELVGEMQKAQTALSLLPMQDVDKIDIPAGFGGLITATSKVALLGEMATVRIARELLTSIHEALLRVMARLVPLYELKTTKKFHETERDQHQAEADRMGITVEEYFRRMISSRDSADAKNKMTFHLNQAKEHEAEVLKATIDINDENIRYSFAVLSETKVLSQKLDELIFSIRSELGLETSREELQATSSAMQEAAAAALRKLYDKVDPSGRSS